MSSPKWTENQRSVIDAPTANVLVNAGAGTGKTATMIERIFALINKPENPCPVKNMLVVTFTNAAAAEMRERLALRIEREIDVFAETEASSETQRYLELQLAGLSRASISTLHSFCYSVLQDHGYLIGLSPDVELMDDSDATLFQEAFLEDETERLLEDDAMKPVMDSILCNLHPIYGLENLRGQVTRIHNWLSSLPDAEQTITHILKEYTDAGNDSVPFSDLPMLSEYREWIVQRVSEIEAAQKKILDKYKSQNLNPLAEKWLGKFELQCETTRKIARELRENDRLPDVKTLVDCPRRFSESKKNPFGPADEQLHEESARYKDLTGQYKKMIGDLSQVQSLDQLRTWMAAQEPFVRLLTRTLGIELMQRMDEECIKNGRVTFNQLERLSLRLFRDHQNVRDQYRSQFEHVFVDEFQDINPLQSELLRCVSRADLVPGNLFVVGDGKQSIYGFRQADMDQFLSMMETYRYPDSSDENTNGIKFNLVENFRSQPKMLRTLNGIFAKLFSKQIGGISFDESQAFVPGREEIPTDDPTVEFCFLNDNAPSSDDHGSSEEDDDFDLEKVEREAFSLIKMIRDGIDSGKIDPGDTAILVRKSKGRTQALAKACRHYSVPFATNEATDFFSEQEIIDCINLLRIISNPLHEAELIGTLRGPTFNWSEEDLLQLRDVSNDSSLFENLQTLSNKSESISDQAVHALTMIQSWQKTVREESIGDFMNRLFRETRLLEIHGALANGEQRVQNLLTLRNQAISWDAFSRRGLAEFLVWLECLLQREKLPGKTVTVSEDDNAVRILTIHKSKGLQFGTVFLPFLNEKMNQMDLREPVIFDKHGFATSVTPSLPYGKKHFSAPRIIMENRLKDKLISEELRLLYVAMTRAEKRLVILITHDDLEKIQDPKKASAAPESMRRVTTLAGLLYPALHDFPQFRNLSDENPVFDDHDSGLRFTSSHVLQSPTARESEKPERENESSRQRQEAEFWKHRLPDLEITAKLCSTEPWRAKLSVTEAKRLHESVHHERNPNAEYTPPTRKDNHPDWFPQFMTTSDDDGTAPKKLASSERGTAWHRYLSLIDLAGIKRGQSFQQEAERLQQAQLLSPKEAVCLDFEQIETFFRYTTPGKSILAHCEHVYREIPFTWLIRKSELLISDETENKKEDGDEELLLQGIIDLVYLPPEDFQTSAPDLTPSPFVLDFKTDQWHGTARHFEELVERYRLQILLYHMAMERTTRREFPESWLHFFDAEQSWPLAPDRSGAGWKEYLKTGFMQTPA